MLHNGLCRRRLSPLLWEVAGVWLVAWDETGFDRGPACNGTRKFLPAVFIKLAEGMFDIYCADTLVCGVTKGRSERELAPVVVLIFPKPSDRKGFTPSDLFPKYPYETVGGAGACDSPLFLRKVEMIAHVKIKE